MLDIEFEDYEDDLDPDSYCGMTGTFTLEFSGGTFNQIVELGSNPRDINNFYRNGRLLLKKPYPPRIFIRNMRTREKNR